MHKVSGANGISRRWWCRYGTFVDNDGRDVAAVAGYSLLQPVLDVLHDHLAGLPPCRRRTPRPVADGVARRIVDNVGHVLEEELLAPRGGGVVDEGERREASLLRSGVVGARGVPRDTTAR